METEDTKILVLKQIDTIIEKYSPERGEKFFTKDIFVYLITVGSSFCIEEYYHLDDKKLADKIHNAFNNEAAWVKKHCSDYAYSATIQPRLKKLRDRVEKMLTPKQKAERNAEFQKTVVDLLTQILEVIKNDKRRN